MARKAPEAYTVMRAQDGAQVRADLTLAEAQRECSNLNAQARIQTGVMGAAYGPGGEMLHGAAPIYTSMIHGEISKYEIRTSAGLVIA